jgi:arylsulfatase A-like enzyme
VQPVYGTIYTGSSKKNAEHGGMSFADVNVGLIVSNPRLQGATIKTPVLTSQVAPTILRALDIDPENLNAVRVEHTTVLPGLFDRD